MNLLQLLLQRFVRIECVFDYGNRLFPSSPHFPAASGFQEKDETILLIASANTKIMPKRTSTGFLS